MNTQTRREVRSGLIALALSALLFVLGIAWRGPGFTDPEGAIRAAASPVFVPAWTILLVGVVLQIYGYFGLYRYLTYQIESLIAFLAFVLSSTGMVLFLPLNGFLPISLPVLAELYQQGNQEVIAVVEANFTSGLALVLFGVSAVATIIGAILFGIAIWRHGSLPKWTSVTYVLSVLLAFPITFATELLGAVLYLISTGVIAWNVWQESAHPVKRL